MAGDGQAAGGCPGAVRSCDTACLHLRADVLSVRHGRYFVAAEVEAREGARFSGDAALVAAELVANALQHGEPPFEICVSGDASRVRVEMRDGSVRLPV